METFNYKDDRFSIRPQAPPGGETHFNISDSGYGDKNIHHPYKRNNHPSNDINPPPNFVKKEDVIESTPNGAAPVTGNRPSIKLRAPPGGFSNLNYYSEENNSKPVETTEAPETQNGVVYDEPEVKNQSSPSLKPAQSEPQTETQAPPPKPEPTEAPKASKATTGKQNSSTKQNNQTTFSSSFFGSNKENETYKPYYAPQAPPGGKSSISLSFDDPPVNQPKPRQRHNPEFQESSLTATQENKTPRRGSNNTKQNNQSTFQSSFFNSNEEENKPYKPYYAPQAPPGGKDSISIGYNESENKTPRRGSNTKQNNQTTFQSSFFNSNEEEKNKPYKPYYAPQAPPGGKDSISIGNNSNNEPETSTTTSFSGRRRNYNRDHFKSSISFDY